MTFHMWLCMWFDVSLEIDGNIDSLTEQTVDIEYHVKGGLD